MKQPLIFLALLLALATFCSAAEIDSLVGKCFKLDKEVTQKYLTENRIIPEDRIHKLDKFMNHLVVCFEKDKIRTEAWSGTRSSPYKVILQARGKIVLKVQNEEGDWNETRITLTEDGYWQETDVFRGYREKFTTYIKPTEPNKAVQTTAMTPPPSATPLAPLSDL